MNATRIALLSVIVLCGITDKCGLFGPKIGEKLMVGSTPEGAKVKIDGVDVGVTPLTLSELDVEENQKQHVTFELEGYVTVEQEITWTQPEQTLAVSLEKAATERVITIKSIPSGAKVYIDGNKKSDTPCTFSQKFVEGDEFNLLLQEKGYSDVSKKVTIGADTIVTVTVNFKRPGGEGKPDLDEVLLEAEKKWKGACKTYPSDVCPFEYTIDPSGTVTNVENVGCKFKDINNCTKKQVEKMIFPSTGSVRSDSYTFKGSN